MKKTNLLVLSVAAALLATSCSKDQVSEVNPGEAIRFSALTGSATKAAEVTSSNLAEYKVYGVYETTTSLNFVDTYTNSGSGWTNTGGTHYWPSTATENVTFFAHSPADLATALGVESIGTPTADSWVIPSVILPDSAKHQKDVVYARYRTNKGTTGDAAVPITLKHVFTQIELKGLCSDDSVRVTVYGAKIFGMKDGGSLTFPTENTEASSEPTMIWGESNNSARTYVVGSPTNTTPVILTDVAASIMGTDGNFMLVPQVLTAWDPASDKPNTRNGGYIGILCKMERLSPEGTYQQIFPETGTTTPEYTAVPIGYNFAKNKKYSITLKFFDGNGGGGVTPPDGSGGGGDPVLAPITFTVSVTDWATGDNVDAPLSK